MTYDYYAWTDGSCNNLSPFGEGGSAFYIEDADGREYTRASKGFLGTTNNKMELLAIINAVKSVPFGSSILIHTDSEYCIKVCTNKRPHKENRSLILLFFKECTGKTVHFEWVKGHSGIQENELVDAMACERKEEIRKANNIPVYNRFNSPKVRKQS